MSYKILYYSYKKASKLGVHIESSKKKNKKIDVYDKNNNYLCSIGDNRYLDYPYYLKYYGSDIAIKKKINYRKRHHKDILKLFSPGYYAYHILW